MAKRGRMARSLALAIALASAALVKPLPAPAQTGDRTLPMHFDLRLQGPAEDCGAKCQLWISASGAITAGTARDFELFAQGRDLTGATVALDSYGGSVLGAIALGRDIRRFGLDTTVGRIVDLAGSDRGTPRGKFSGAADCESMCGFVLLGGVHRAVPPQARVMVHQIWLGDRRDDPTAANYSAEDLVLVQRDIGRLARYTIDMGGSIELLNIALRIPPWEPMHALTADEMRRTRLVTITADRLIVTAGAWTQRLFPDWPVPLRPTRQQVLYFRPPDRTPSPPDVSGLHCQRRRRVDDFYGMPPIDGLGVKVATTWRTGDKPRQPDPIVGEAYCTSSAVPRGASRTGRTPRSTDGGLSLHTSARRAISAGHASGLPTSSSPARVAGTDSSFRVLIGRVLGGPCDPGTTEIAIWNPWPVSKARIRIGLRRHASEIILQPGLQRAWAINRRGSGPRFVVESQPFKPRLATDFTSA